MFSFRKVRALTLASVLVLAACSDDDDGSAATTTAAPEVTTTTAAEVDDTTTTAAPAFDSAAAAAEVEANVVDLFDQLAIAGDPDSDPADAEAALAAAGALVEDGETDEIKSTIPTIAGLAFAAQLTIVIDEAPTFDDAGTTANYLFSALSFGNPSQLDKANGISVLQDGTWKLSKDIWAAFVAMGGGADPDDMGDDFDAEAAADEVSANVIGLFDQLAIAGNPDSDPVDAAAAVGAAAGLIEGGDCPEVRGQVPFIAGLAFAAELTTIIDEPATFDDSHTTANYIFSALSFGNPSQLDKASGVSVLENGVWKLSGDIWVAFLALGGGEAPDPNAPFDPEVAADAVSANVVDLFDQLAIAGNPDSDPRLVAPALAAAACLVQDGYTEEVQEQIPVIAGLAAAAELTLVIDETPTFDDAGTTSNYVFSALSFGSPSQLDKANGVSVLDDGVWKLSSDIWQAFVVMGGG